MQKFLQKLVSHELTAYLSVLNLFLTQWIMALCKLDIFESHNSLKLSFTNIWGLHSYFFECESFLEWNLWHFCSMWDKLWWLIWFWQFLSERLSSLNLKRLYYSYAWSCSLCERRTFFCKGLVSRKLFVDSYLCFWLALLTQCLTSFSFVDHLLCCYAWLLILFYLT